MRIINRHLCFSVSLTFVIFTFLSNSSDALEDLGKDSRLITNVIIYDGAGNPPFNGSVEFQNESIVKVYRGQAASKQYQSIIDGGGLALVPGFIDTHSHHDIGIDEQPLAVSAVTQGITTIVRGVDGFSDSPASKTYISLSNNYFSLKQFKEYFSGIPVAINMASFSAHNSIRYQVMGKDFRREATNDEIKLMEKLVNDDMEEGAYGLSTGLEYDPGIYSASEEVVRLTKAIADFDGRYKSHIRSEDREYWEAIDEIIHIAKETGVPVNIDHFKLNGVFNWGRTKEVLDILNQAREAGVNITADVYPYEAWSSSITTLYPERNFTDEEETNYILEKLSAAEDIRFSHHEIHPEYINKTVADIATMKGISEVQALSNLSEESYRLSQAGNSIEMVVAKGMVDRDVRELLNWPFANVCSDGELICGHPRGCGTFPKVLSEYQGIEGIGSIERIIYKMTGLSAKTVGIENRGLIEPGNYADFLLIDLKLIKDNSTFLEPKKLSDGIHSVWVNGMRVLDDGEFTNARPGKILLKEDKRLD
ncbi:MAG: amidohydrolase family protein [Gammaproteobacteria bacterium]|jgi:N-acyl-D-amino-acid deacylase|nr:aminoacylase [Gammaproteobacteria bacterium]MDP6146760.1 amidohydrolase family protein [Gammaproteobacteria bacterium]HJN00727.1 amidohydrolase family protein [Gammaproteobacteria bacterium]|tara:strand:+ start:17089 stop:18696 length:1608 start_codon:yes stop_codon:yes gene_type:complete